MRAGTRPTCGVDPTMNARNLVLTILFLLSLVLPATAWEAAAPPNSAASRDNHLIAGDEEHEQKTIAVLGSSVASGWVTSHDSRYDMRNGYAYRLARLLAPAGYRVVNISIPGDDTAAALERIERDLIPLEPDYVIIGLSMANEGLATGDPQQVLAKYKQGLTAIIERCEEDGIVSIVGACYPCDLYEPEHYQAIKQANRELYTWDVPSINFLGAVDDGLGHFPAGTTYDASHPDNRGHEEMFYAIVPSLFEALDDNLTVPERVRNNEFFSAGRQHASAALSYVPDHVLHAFTLAFDVRRHTSGALASVDCGSAKIVLAVDDAGRVEYRSSTSAKVISRTGLDEKAWCSVALVHRHLQGETLLFIDGQQVGAVKERLEPRQFVLGGAGMSTKRNRAARADFKDWLGYRSALNAGEIEVLAGGGMISASLEIYAPLADGELASDAPLCNLAQSRSRAIHCPTNTNSQRARLEARIAQAQNQRENELVVVRKQPVAIDPKLFEDYVGTYRVAPGFDIEVTTDSERLLADPRGEGKIELLPESPTAFFIRFPLAEIRLTFLRDADEAVDALVFSIDGQENRAPKVE